MDLPLSDPTLPSPPFIHCPGLANLRDIGGYALRSPSRPTARSVRRGLLFRSADPTRVTPEGLDVLTSLRLGKAFDLRSIPEIQRLGKEWAGLEEGYKSPFWSEREDEVDGEEGEEQGKGRAEREEKGDRIERVWTPVFATKDYSPEKVGLRFKAYTRGAEGFKDAYRDILANAGKAYATILRHLSKKDAEPALVHCTAGKDRTGMLVAVLYLLLGVDEETICREYALTDEGLRLMKPIFKERLLKNDALVGNEEGVENMISSKEENMRVTLGLIKEVWGSADSYVKEVVGLSEEEVVGLRKNFESEEAPVL
ncbi:protein tyrosine phosphatase-like protein 2 [Elsinoe australis]|uniref:Protein tyrosine phosphatase-like protein 2 n=1 Tax=Elsinoe australis TaxID=40998 RepID=A0A4U7B811_9PEZI|nr:protein tyrosine phosphatase-like protein 2 [Elsinoe australis]